MVGWRQEFLSGWFSSCTRLQSEQEDEFSPPKGGSPRTQTDMSNSSVSHAGLQAVLTMCLILAVLSLTGCAQTRATRETPSEGFLSKSEWALMKKNPDPPPELDYINPSVDWSQYKGVVVDSISFWSSTGEEKLGAEEQQMILEYFYAALHREISKAGNVVDQPGPGIARLRFAITNAKGANVPVRVVTTVVPQLKLLTAVGGLTDTSVTVGTAGFEAKLTDSMTDQLLACAADRRAGQKIFKGMTDKWSDIKAAIDLWAETFAGRWAKRKGVISSG